MILRKSELSGVLLSGFLCLILSTSGYAADAAAQTQTQTETQTKQTQTPAQTTQAPAQANNNNTLEGLPIFALSRTMWKAIEDSDSWAEQGVYLTTLPFYAVTDFLMSATVTTVVPSGTIAASTQKHSATWNNPKSMIAKSIEPQGR